MNWLSKAFGKERDLPGKPQMLKIIEEQFSQKDKLSDHNKWVVETIIHRFSPRATEELKNELLQFEQQANKSKEPLGLLRSEIMKIVDSSCLNSALMELSDEQRAAVSTIGETFSDEAILGTYLSNEFQTACLRLYCLAQFGDGGPTDWFTMYAQAAKEDGKHMVNVLCASVGKYDGDPALLAQLHTSYQTAMADLRGKLLATPVGATFPE
jgi:hypothetical protein